jgi:hypothetical protein
MDKNRRNRILVADHNPIFRETVARWLRAAGYEVTNPRVHQSWPRFDTQDRLRPSAACHANQGATPVPHWMRAARPNRAGMFIPGLLIALMVFAAANGILSTVLELAWL